jgi:predicted transcriptional regulator
VKGASVKAQYRNRGRIISEILSALRAPSSGGAKTVANLMKGCNISYQGLQRLLSELVSADMVLRVQVRIRSGYVLTEKGSEYLRRYKEFERLTETFGIKP